MKPSTCSELDRPSVSIAERDVLADQGEAVGVSDDALVALLGASGRCARASLVLERAQPGHELGEAVGELPDVAPIEPFDARV